MSAGYASPLVRRTCDPSGFMSLAKLNDPAVIIPVFVILDQEIPAVCLLVVAEVADGCADDGIRRGDFVPLRPAGVGAVELIDQLVFEEHPIAAVFELSVQKDVAVAGELQI